MMRRAPPPPPVRPNPPPPTFLPAPGLGWADALFIAAIFGGSIAIAVVIGPKIQEDNRRFLEQEEARFLAACARSGRAEDECRFLMLRDARQAREDGDKAFGAFVFGLAVGANK